MRRSLAGLLFGLASIVGSLALSAFWLQYTAFSPGHTRGAAAAVLEDSDIKAELARIITENTAPLLPEIPPPDLHARVVFATNTTEGGKLLANLVADAHAHLIGASDKPVQITPDEIVAVVGDQRAAAATAVVFDVPKVTALSVIREILKWLVPISAGLAVLLIALGFAAHPERSELFRSLGFMLMGMALLLVVIGYVVPAFVVPIFTDNVWVGALPRLARDSLGLLVAMTVLLVGVGVGCLALSSASRRRDRWSQPIRRTNYREERRWS